MIKSTLNILKKCNQQNIFINTIMMDRQGFRLWKLMKTLMVCVRTKKSFTLKLTGFFFSLF